MFAELRRLAHHSAAYSLGVAISKAFAFILVPLYTRHLTKDEYGAYVLLNAGAAVLGVLYEFGVSSAVMRFYYDYDDPRELRRYLGSVWVLLMVVTGGLSTLLTFGAAPLLHRLYEGIDFWPYVVLTIWASFLGTANVIPWVLLRVREQSSRFVVLIAAQAAVLLAGALVFVVWLQLGLLGAVLASLAQSAAMFLFFTVYTLRNASLRIGWHYLPSTLAYGLPVVVLMAGWWVLDASDRFILKHFTALNVVAVYSVGYAIGRVLILFSQAINAALTPFFFSTVKEGREDAPELFSYTATYFTLVISALGLIVVVFTREAVLFFGGHAYLEATKVTPLIVLGSVAQGMFYVPSRGLFLQKKTKVLPPILLVGVVVNISLNFLLIPVLGMTGAAWATLAGYVATVAVTFVVSQRYYRVDYQVGRLVRILAILSVIAALATYYQPTSLLWIIAWKVLLLAAAPLMLLVSGFLDGQEKEQLKRLRHRGWHQEAA